MILEHRKSKSLSRLALARFAGRAQRAAKLKGEVTILLTGDQEIRELNAQFRHKDKATDVLSFPADPALSARQAGDIAISLETARAQAREMGHDLSTEVKVLILHGMLHLAGYDHEADHGQMRRQEAKLRAQLRLPAGLIERASDSGRSRLC
ncbi:MAG: rRNA maturation RNase YbeY [Acidobacteriota bacterium]|nr:rRNA maturation RNase YbeY [Acidobacteriota bacterium]